jgi:DNA repair exonuclease SbcCD ATPase subunit
MIIFEKVTFKNFLSFGNKPTSIELNSTQNTLIIGKNGCGKSVFMDAITYSLFGKAYRPINKPQLINIINQKDCLVEIEFKVGTIEWKVRRGQKPNIFEIYRNGKMIDQNASSTDQQKWFEQNVLKMNYKSFTQIVILGNSNFTPFMQLTPASRREVIEELLDIKIFSSMNIVVKDKIKKIKDELKILEIKKNTLDEKVLLQSNFISEIEKEGKNNILERKNKILSLEQLKENYELENTSLISEVDKMNLKLDEFTNVQGKLKKLGTLKGKLHQKISSINTEHKFFSDNTICPTCTQSLDDEFRKTKITQLEENINNLNSGYDDLCNTIKEEEIREIEFNKLSKEIVNINHKISQNNLKSLQHKKQITDLAKEILTIKDKIENKNQEHKKLEQFLSELEQVSSEYENKKDLMCYYDYTYSLLKDNGVKSKIIKKYLPVINLQLNKYLQRMDFYVNFSLDEEFNETIKSPLYEDFSYGSFSEGQKQRINLALLFTWREIAKIKNSTNVNLLILDEVFDSSLDANGTDEFLKIIKYIVKDSNIFVISHKEGIQDKFETTFEVERKINFSQIVRK